MCIAPNTCMGSTDRYVAHQALCSGADMVSPQVIYHGALYNTFQRYVSAEVICSADNQPLHIGGSTFLVTRRTTAKLQKRAFSGYKRRRWIIMRAERAGATRTHARSALAGHTDTRAERASL